MSPDELYEYGLRQSRVGTPYFCDNDDDERYKELLKSTLPEDFSSNRSNESDSPQTIMPGVAALKGMRSIRGSDGTLKRMSRSAPSGNYDATLFGNDVFEGIQKEVRIKKKRKKKKGFLGLLDYLIHLIPIKSPTSKIRQVWDGTSILVIVFSVYTAMFEQAFQPDTTLASEDPSMFILDKLSETFFWIDVVFNFFTSDFDSEGDLVKDRAIICRNYVGSWFLVDVISNLPLGGGLSLLKGLRLFRFPRILLRWAYLGYSTKALNLFKLVIAITTSGHLVACMFYFIARTEDHDEENWTVYDGLYTIRDDWKECKMENSG